MDFPDIKIKINLCIRQTTIFTCAPCECKNPLHRNLLQTLRAMKIQRKLITLIHSLVTTIQFQSSKGLTRKDQIKDCNPTHNLKDIPTFLSCNEICAFQSSLPFY